MPLGRGNSVYSTFDLEKADADTQRYDEPLLADENWRRITYFLERVIPVATECQVRMAAIPAIPGYRPVSKE